MEKGKRKEQKTLSDRIEPGRAITLSASAAVSCIILKPSPTFSSMVTSRISLGKTGGLSLTSCSVISTCRGRINTKASVKALPAKAVKKKKKPVHLLGFQMMKKLYKKGGWRGKSLEMMRCGKLT